MNDIVIKAECISKKFCKSLRYVMTYGATDITRDFFNIKSKTEKLRDGEFWAVDDVSFELKRGETLGVIGPNGSGKSSILKMLNGIYMPDQGKIEIKDRVGALIEVGAGFHPMLTGRENIYVNGAILGMSKKEIDKKFDEIVDFADIGDSLDSPVKHYSSGMFVRLGFAAAVHCEPDILLVDEVLSVGDYGFQCKCLSKIGDLKKKGTAVILVSHNMHTISSSVNEVILLNNGKHVQFESVTEGITAYRRLFYDSGELSIEKVKTGNAQINFYDIKINKRKLFPNDSFSIELFYNSYKEYKNIQIVTAVYSSNEQGLHFEATNKAFNKKINLLKGKHSLKITLQNMMINGASALIALSIWSDKREELIFWWRIPVEFDGVNYSTGNNFLNVMYELKSKKMNTSHKAKT